jgi:hypothetical protein
MDRITFNADSVKVNGPLSDGSYSITFKTGEYEQLNVAKLMVVPQMTELIVGVEYGE